MLDDRSYEDFMRKALKSNKNSLMGADVDTFRDLVGAYNVFLETDEQIKQIQDKEIEGSPEFWKYNKVAVETALFVRAAIKACKVNLDLNDVQISKLESLEVKSTFDSIVAAVSTAIEITTARTTVFTNNDVQLLKQIRSAKQFVYDKIYHFQGVDKIEIEIKLTPSEKGGLEEDNSFTFSDDTKSLQLRAFVRASYNNAGELEAIDLHREFDQSFDIIVYDAINAHKPNIV